MRMLQYLDVVHGLLDALQLARLLFDALQAVDEHRRKPLRVVLRQVAVSRRPPLRPLDTVKRSVHSPTIKAQKFRLENSHNKLLQSSPAELSLNSLPISISDKAIMSEGFIINDY